MIRFFTLILSAVALAFSAFADEVKTSSESAPLAAPETIIDNCKRTLTALPGPQDPEGVTDACQKATLLDDCFSSRHAPIYHYQKEGTDRNHGKKILSISLIHGDEVPAGSVTRAWMARLEKIDPRNTWRVIPIVNPDGLSDRTRYNANKVDLNRNFPSKDWDINALKYWEQNTKKDARRFPGPKAASEVETRCLVKHIDEFKPDFIISIHTPLGVLDFDGPNIGNPGFKPLPWVGLGNFAGSLGRYMWLDRKVPVLTIELKGNEGVSKLEEFDQLQDISGTVAIQSGKILSSDKNIKKNNSKK